jgi:hypothetical protein
MAEREIQNYAEAPCDDLDVGKATMRSLQDLEKQGVSRLVLRVEDLLQRSQPGAKSVTRERTTVAPFGIAELRIHPAEPRPGESVIISFKATNNSDVHSVYPVTLRVDGQVVSAEVVSVPPRAALPLSFAIVEVLPGDYRVDVNYSTGRFTVLAMEPGSKVEESDVRRPKTSYPEVRFESGQAEVGAGGKRNEVVDENIIAAPSRLQVIIDKIADHIEFGLDRMGNAMISPITKLVDVFTTLFKVAGRNVRR